VVATTLVVKVGLAALEKHIASAALAYTMQVVAAQADTLVAVETVVTVVMAVQAVAVVQVAA
jgi:plasmid maintenance system antidote protein VapI